MHPSLNSVDFRVSAPTVSPLPSKNNLNLTKLSDQKKNNDDKSLEKRAPSPSTSSTVKPPYSYIALSN